VGNPHPLDQAVEHATTEMLSWLKEDWIGHDQREPVARAMRRVRPGQCFRSGVYDGLQSPKSAASFFVSGLLPTPPRQSESHFVILVFRLTVFLRDAFQQTHQRRRPWI
jgi:hypothetical protein